MQVKRIFIAVTLIAAITQPTASADVTVIEGDSISPKGASPVGTMGKIFKLVVTPAKEASPAFKHRFVVPPHETIPGNAITHYLRSLGERGLHRPWDYVEQETDGKVHDFYSIETKTDDIPLEKLKQCSNAFDGLVNHLERATRCRDADWGYAFEDLRGIEAIGFLLPSVQNTRMMARSLMLQHRFALIEKRFDDAVDRLRMAYQLGRNVNEMDVLVSSLVGLAEVGMANNGVLLQIGEDGSPNLYWALAELPTPVIDARRALQLDISMAERLFPELMDIENADYADGEWKRLMSQYTQQFSTISALTASTNAPKPAMNQTAAEFAGFLGSMSGYSGAKRRLVERGYDEKRVSTMCVAQVILTDAAIDIDYFSQLASKSWHIPYPESHKFSKAFATELRAAEKKLRLGAIIAGMVSPASSQIRSASVISQAKINLLMAIESLRNHAAVHGEFPQALTDLDLPVRKNPLTGKPFHYSLEGGKAVLTFDPPKPYQGLQRYEISMKK